MIERFGTGSTASAGLIDIINQVRNRWRAKLTLRGVVWVLAIAFSLFLLAAYGLEWARFTGNSIMAARVGIVVAIVASVWFFLVRPLRRRVTDEQVALYLEEHEPSLQATLVSAIEANRGGESSQSEALVRRLVEQAVEACALMNAPRRVEEAPMRRYGALLAGVAAVAVASVLLGPGFLRSALSAIFVMSRSVEAAAPYQISVQPGDMTVPRGADLTITATLFGFATEDASLMVRRTPTAPFEALPLVKDEEGGYEGMVFDIAEPMEYFVEAEGVRSTVYTFTVVDVPYVQRLQFEFHYPAYTGLEPQQIEDGGDIAVLRGTEIRLRVIPTMATPGGRLALNEESIELAAPAEDGSLAVSFMVDADGSYRIELDAPTGERVAASPQYTIDVLTDQAPTVSFTKPGRDISASPIEEIFVEATAEDDFGVRNLELVYSVNGGERQSVRLFGGRNRLPEVSAGHTFYLEELNVEPGDAVSYFARAADNDAVGGGKSATSDLYFLRIRPFDRDFRQAQSQGGGGGGGGGGGQVEALSEQQRQIISATFNVQRDRQTMTVDKLRESTTVVALSQSRLREQVEGLVTRLNSQLVERDPAFSAIVEMLPQAVEAMQEAEGRLAAVNPDEALPPEHRALQILQKAEEEYEQQVSVQQGGGGGGGGSAQQQELAEIFEQELERMASRYETANQAAQQQGDQEVDELLEKLKELARRQEQEAERQRRRALDMQAQGGGAGGGSAPGSAQQRALAEQAEEAARRLERLAREEQRPDLMESARQMREAADAMRRAAAGGGANASAQAQEALERLRETERRLQQSLTARAERDIQDAIRQADEIARQQERIADDVQDLAALGNSTTRRQEAQDINEDKDELESRLSALEQQLDQSARDASREEREASRKMAEAAGSIRDNRLADKVRYSRNLVTRGASQQAYQATENDIASGIGELRERLEEAAAAIGQADNADRMETALERARRLARGLDSLQERTRERAEQGQQARGEQPGEQQGGGQQGESGDQGQGEGQGEGQGQQGQGDGGGPPGQAAGGRSANGQNAVDQFGGFGVGFDGWWRNGELSDEAIRQLRGEVREWTGEAVELRQLLAGENIDPAELDEILGALRQLDDPRVYQDIVELQRLQRQVAEGLKRFEFGLRRQLDADGNVVVLSGSDEVPEEFRKLVEQYYRELARQNR